MLTLTSPPSYIAGRRLASRKGQSEIEDTALEKCLNFFCAVAN